MRKVFIDAGYDMKEDGDAAAQDSDFIISIHGVIYPIFEDYSWDRDIRGIYYGGSGGDVALGVMEALHIDKTKTPEQAEKIIRRAIEVACLWDIYTSAPIITKIQYAK
jgi:ATP-dependent protease HslVU (ClpYQ) peptidase subunit